MKAMIFAAGKGSRFGERTATVPKALVQLAGRALIDHVLDRLVAAGVKSVMINLHHLGEMIQEHFLKHPRPGVEIAYSSEEQLLETGGGLKQASWFFAEEKSFFLYNCDVWSDLDLCRLIETGAESGSVATLALVPRESTRQLLFDKERRLVGRRGPGVIEMAVASQEVDITPIPFTGIQLVSGRLLPYLNEFGQVFSIIDVYLAAARAGEQVQGVLFDQAHWFDVGSEEKLARCEAFLREKENEQ